MDHGYWFPAKRYGWGWGPPIAWQGWLALTAFVVLLVAGAVLLLPGRRVAYIAYAIVLGLAMIGLCWLKGEPPRWRWGQH